MKNQKYMCVAGDASSKSRSNSIIEFNNRRSGFKGGIEKRNYTEKELKNDSRRKGIPFLDSECQIPRRVSVSF
jgi:hypothetical protein